MILIYGNRESWSAMDADSFRKLMSAHEALRAELEASGEFVDTNELPIDGAKIVRNKGGVAEVTDGPFVEVKEIVAGYYIVECPSMDRATEIAGKLSEAEFGLVEVRRMTSQPDH
ncbi:YciI family protein [Antrihabitans cavernicola]|nr:YciI family protein [Spelaeibacter cavernicola]